MDPALAGRAYTPARIGLLPLDVFVVYDEVGANDPQKSAALGRQVSAHASKVLAEAIRRRGYDVDTRAAWEGIRGQDGSMLIPGQELGWFVNAALGFSNQQTADADAGMAGPAFVAPEIAARLGWATGSDAILYANLKGVAVSPGKRTAQVFGVVFFVVLVAAIIAIALAESKGGGRGGSRGTPIAGGGGVAGPVRSAGMPARPNAPAVIPGVASGGPAPTTADVIPRGRGRVPVGGGGRTYGHSHGHVGLGIGVVVPLNSSTHTHEGAVADQDDTFAGDQAYLSLTLISAHDGRVLWHVRESVDVELDNPQEVERVVHQLLSTLPPALGTTRAP